MIVTRILYAAALLLLLGGCRKNSSQREPSCRIAGEWELSRVYGGWQEEVEYSRGNGNSFAFTANRYEEYTAHQLVGSGSFDLVKDTVYFVGERDPLVYNVVDKIVLRPDGGIPQYHNLLIGDSTLIFDYGSALYDGRERVYTRRADFFTSPQ